MEENVRVCEDCNKKINLEVDEIITSAKSYTFGYYYLGEGICKTCCEIRYENAHIEYETISD